MPVIHRALCGLWGHTPAHSFTAAAAKHLHRRGAMPETQGKWLVRCSHAGVEHMPWQKVKFTKVEDSSVQAEQLQMKGTCFSCG